MPNLRRGLPPLPDRLESRPIDERGYPVPWFVCQIEGKWDFRVADGAKRVAAVKKRLCWICGQPCGVYLHFMIGPMCAVNRTTSEPGSHRECAEFAARVCPFMLRPKADYRSAALPDDYKVAPGIPLLGNPGVTLQWVTRSFKTWSAGNGWLIELGPPEQVFWWAEGRTATRAEVLESFDKRLPLLRAHAEKGGPESIAEYERRVKQAMELVPA